jgi:septal ring factor EnvC (AmiA/AmiB activator)
MADKTTLVLVLENIAPWVTAAAALAFGLLSHRRAQKTEENDKFSKTIGELHSLYHDLVNDLGDQVARLTETNQEINATNKALLAQNMQLEALVEALQMQKAELLTLVENLTKRVSDLEDKSL